jgi:hypothetical protein
VHHQFVSHQLVIQNMRSTRIIPQVHCPRLCSRSPGSPTIVKSSPRKEEDKIAEGVGKAKVRGKRKNTLANNRGGEAKNQRLSARSVSCSYCFGRGPCRLPALLIIVDPAWRIQLRPATSARRGGCRRLGPIRDRRSLSPLSCPSWYGLRS